MTKKIIKKKPAQKSKELPLKLDGSLSDVLKALGKKEIKKTK